VDGSGANTSCWHTGASSGGKFKCDLKFLNPLESVKITVDTQVLGTAPLGAGGLGGTAPCVAGSALCNKVKVQALNDLHGWNNVFYQPTGVVQQAPRGDLRLDKAPDAD